MTRYPMLVLLLILISTIALVFRRLYRPTIFVITPIYPHPNQEPELRRTLDSGRRREEQKSVGDSPPCNCVASFSIAFTRCSLLTIISIKSIGSVFRRLRLALHSLERPNITAYQ
ncbi:unnamed protein product [Taenia asiatica]|uniref:Secreted protein n=1 Tax=Taenia asiatica TaxID=60517 RepID=A0A0R3WFM0_TAEAS|nr:unnamed protein product [Taenia asiatica]